MSDPNQKEPGRFGEDGAAVIQVTPGQIVGAALFLLVAATIIFFAGVFARGLTMSPAEEEPAPPPTIAKTTDRGVDLPAPEPEKAAPEPEAKPAPPKPAEATTPVQPPKAEPKPEPEPEVVKKAPPVIEMKPVTAEATEPEPAAETTPPEPEPEPEPTPTPPAEEKPAPAPENVTAPPADPEPQPLPEIPPSTTGSFTVQVMSIGTAKRAQAQEFQRDALENKDVQVMLVESSDGKWIRAFVGSYANKADAEKARDELTRAGFEGCFVKKRDE